MHHSITLNCITVSLSPLPQCPSHRHHSIPLNCTTLSLSPAPQYPLTFTTMSLPTPTNNSSTSAAAASIGWAVVVGGCAGPPMYGHTDTRTHAPPHAGQLIRMRHLHAVVFSVSAERPSADEPATHGTCVKELFT